MTTVHRMPDGRHLAFVKGAPRCCWNGARRRRRDAGRSRSPMPRAAEVLAANETMAKDALRVLALAYKEVGESGFAERGGRSRRDLTFLGLSA